MSTLIPDLVGFTGSKSFVNIPGATVTRANIVTTIVSVLTANGWTVLSGPTPTTHGDEYELYSAQSPWYDTTNIPAWYKGGRAYLKIVHPNGTNMALQAGEFYDGAVANAMTSTAFTISPGAFTAGPYDCIIYGNPYELWIWPNTTATPSGTEVYLGTLGVPKPVQQASKVVSAIIMDRWRIGTTQLTGVSQVYLCHRIKDAAVSTYFGNPTRKLAFLSVMGGQTGTFGYRQGRRLWTSTQDVGQTDPTKWRGFFAPAQVSVPLTLGGEPDFLGFLWDSFIYTEGWTFNSNIELIDKSWVCISSSTGATFPCPGSLWLDIGPAGTTL